VDELICDMSDIPQQGVRFRLIEVAWLSGCCVIARDPLCSYRMLFGECVSEVEMR